MKPDEQDPATRINLLRQQLILAQVRIMELEDQLTVLEEQRVETRSLLDSAQQLGDEKLAEVSHLSRLLTETRAQVVQVEKLHHTVARALEESQACLHAAQTQLASIQQIATAATRELSVIKGSRIWRWTRWLSRSQDQTSLNQ